MCGSLLLSLGLIVVHYDACGPAGEEASVPLWIREREAFVTADDRITVAGFEHEAASEDPSLLQVWVAVADDSKRMCG